MADLLKNFWRIVTHWIFIYGLAMYIVGLYAMTPGWLGDICAVAAGPLCGLVMLAKSRKENG